MLFGYVGSAQKQGQALIDSLMAELPKFRQDSNQVLLLAKLSHVYFTINPDTGLFYGEKALAIARKINFESGYGVAYNSLAANYYMKSDANKALYYFEQAAFMYNKYNDKIGVASVIGNMAVVFQSQSNYPKALDYNFQALKMNEELGNETKIASNLQNIGIVYYEQSQYDKALEFYQKSMDKFQKLKNASGIAGNYSNMGNVYSALKKYDQAISNDEKALEIYIQLGDKARMASLLGNIGNRYYGKEESLKALDYNFKALEINRQIGNKGGEAINLGNVGSLLYTIYKDPHIKVPDSLAGSGKLIEKSIQYQLEAEKIATEIGDLSMQQDHAKTLSEIYYDIGRFKESLDYYKKNIALRDSVFSEENKEKIQQLENQRDEDLKQKEIEIQKLQLQKVRNERWYYLTGFVLLILLLLVLLNRFRVKKLSNEKLEKAYNELKSTQQQLIEQEKMASLGVLTAGIAHEIKNPLNFVNNFSEISHELLDELIASNDINEKNQLAESVKQNMEKISGHGRRADSIVQSMLQHARNGDAEQAPTDINSICNEIADLAFHGMKANNPDFNTLIQKEFASGIPLVRAVSQDISRVVVNLLSNAFYAVNEKNKALKKNGTLNEIYKPVVTISTGLRDVNTVLIRIRDNGPGIPDTIRKKIFEPFFTTKPAGQGTGLGLSICYDIVKAHGGQLSLESKINEFTEFIIALPVI